MESGLIFNQLICEFESRHPCQILFDPRLPIADMWLAVANTESIGDRQSKIENAFWGHSLNKNNHREMAKAEASYMPAPAMVHLCKPAQHREVSFAGTRTGGGKDEAGVVERTFADVPAREHR